MRLNLLQKLPHKSLLLSFSSVQIDRRNFPHLSAGFYCFDRLVLGSPMNQKSKSKCQHCSQLFVPDYRNRGRQTHCTKKECRRAAKAYSQQKWTRKTENKNYFSGVDNSARVRQWRKEHPGYSCKKQPSKKKALQEICNTQEAENEVIAFNKAPEALQETCLLQPALIVGLISTFGGFTLQDDIANQVKLLLTRGQDILRYMTQGLPNDERKG